MAPNLTPPFADILFLQHPKSQNKDVMATPTMHPVPNNCPNPIWITPRGIKGSFWFVGLGLSLLLASSTIALGQEAVAFSQLAPADAVAFLHVPNFQNLKQQFEQTSWGKLWNAAEMQAFRAELEQADQGAQETLKAEYGFGLTEVFDSNIEELAVIGLQVQEREVALTLAARFPDAVSANAFQQAAIAELKRRGAQVADVDLGTPATQVDLAEKRQQVIYFLQGDYAVVSGDVEAARRILQRWPLLFKAADDDEADHGLNSNAAYAYIQQQTNAEAASDVRWFADAISLAALTSQTSGQLKSADGSIDTRPPFPQRHGFPQVKGVGGQVALLNEPFDYLLRTAVYAPGPRREVMRIFEFPAGDVAASETVPAEVSTNTILRWDIKSLFSHVGPLVDDVADSPNYWTEILSDVKTDYRVDLLNDLAPKLGPRISLMSIYSRAKQNERTLAAIDIQGGAESYVASVLFRFFQKDPDAQPRKLPGQRNELWKIRFRLGGDDVAFSEAGWMVADGKLWISTHASWIEENVRKAFANKLIDDDHFRRTAEAWKQLVNDRSFAQLYARTDLDFEFTYETLRRGGVTGLKKAENLYGNLLLQAIDALDWRIDSDFSKLPEFDKVRHYFGVTRASASNLDQGWMILLGGHRAPSLDVSAPATQQ